MVMSLARSGSALVRLIGYGPGEANTVGAKLIVSAPASALAALIASRSVQSLLPVPVPSGSQEPSSVSAVVLTTNAVELSLLKVTVAVFDGPVEVFPLPAKSNAAFAGIVIVTAPLEVIPSMPTL